MRFRALAVIAFTCLFWLTTWLVSPPTFALTQVKLSDLSYHDCPPELAGGTLSGGSGAMARCFIITGKAENSSNKPVINADVYGRIYDANDDPVMQNRTRVGSIDEIPPGTSDFEVRISVPDNQPTPLKLEQFKASGFTGKVRR